MSSVPAVASADVAISAQPLMVSVACGICVCAGVGTNVSQPGHTSVHAAYSISVAILTLPSVVSFALGCVEPDAIGNHVPHKYC